MKHLYLLLFFLFTLSGCTNLNFHPIDLDNRIKPINIDSLLPNLQKDRTVLRNFVDKGKAVGTVYDISNHRLLVLKLNKAHKNFMVSIDQHDAWDNGIFTLVPVFTFGLQHSSALNDSYTIKKIAISTADKKIVPEIYTDSIKSYYLSFEKFSLRINDDADLQLHSENDGYMTNHNTAELLFYTKGEMVYLFLMQKSDLTAIQKGTLYQYLFPKA